MPFVELKFYKYYACELSYSNYSCSSQRNKKLANANRL